MKKDENLKASAMSRLFALLTATMLMGSLAACGTSDSDSERLQPLSAPDISVNPPVAEKREFYVTAPHGAAREDEYYWLRDDQRQDPEVLAYLQAENEYSDAAMAPLAGLQDQLYKEMVGRIQKDQASLPYHYKDYWYYSRFDKDSEYPVFARRKGSMDAAEEIMLDVNQLAENHAYYQIGNMVVSPDQNLLAYVVDTAGNLQYVLYVKNLATGETFHTGVTGISDSLAWAQDNQTIFYTWNAPQTLLTKSIKAHQLTTDPASDPVVYHEPDDSFFLSVDLTSSEEYICIYSESHLTTEQRCADAANPVDFEVISPRERGVNYWADHLDGRWVVRTNRNAPNFKLMAFPDGERENPDQWTELVAHDETVLISSFMLFDDFIAIAERAEALARIRLLLENGEQRYVESDEPAYVMYLADNFQPDSQWLRYTYTSLTTPDTTYELNIMTGERRLLKESPVLGGFDKNNYITERLWAPARDGSTQIPVSIVYHKNFTRDGSAGLLQFGYGAYGFSIDPFFSENIISLLDRGMVLAIAHVRGGQDLGSTWYEEGKLLNKINTFTDYIDVTRYLVKEGYAAPDRVAALGDSAGGMLMGAVANMAPNDYRAMVLQVPFVDVVTTMLDESIPLTTNEYDEWGNPADPMYYDYMLSYSPYDQIGEIDYPAMYVQTGLWDAQVQYWEPAKYAARLRDRRTDDDLLLLRTQMDAGHGGSSGRFQYYHDVSEYYAFILNQLGYGGGFLDHTPKDF